MKNAEAATPPGPKTYEVLYEAVARALSDEDAVGGGSFDHVGRLELSLLLLEGLKPTDTLVDFGCGTGRLALQVIPVLLGGRYVGIDVSQSMLDRARQRVTDHLPDSGCDVRWVKQTSPEFPVIDGGADMICAFSVFTHMEHEDSYRYLQSALRAIRPGGRCVFSCLPMDLACSREIFLTSAGEDLEARWSKVRSVTTSVDLMTAIARLAGWSVLRWYPGDQENVRMWDTGRVFPFVQSVCVLEAPSSEGAMKSRAST